MLFATALVLLAAVLHASWNLLVKTSIDRDLAIWGQFSAAGVLVLPLLVFVGLPGRDAWWPLVASSAVHVVYVLALARAYRFGDFSLTYPLSRGLGAAVAALGGLILLNETLSAPAWLAVAVVLIGLMSLAAPAGSTVATRWAIATGVAIGTYTLIDAVGARRTAGLEYPFALAVTTMVALSLTQLLRGRGRALAASLPEQWRRYALSGILLTTAYSLVLVAVRHAPVAYVATLRESSVVIGAAAGWLLLGESEGRRRVLAATLVAGGLVALVALR